MFKKVRIEFVKFESERRRDEAYMLWVKSFVTSNGSCEKKDSFNRPRLKYSNNPRKKGENTWTLNK